MGLIKAITRWLEADAMDKLATAEAIDRGDGQGRDEGPGPEGGYSDNQIGNNMPTEPELHSGYRPGHFWFEDRGHISLRWRPPC
jgi:hypothetical protein